MARRKKTKSTDKGIPLIDLTAEPDINQVNESLEKVDELLTTSYEEEELKLSDHINKSVTNPDGVHNFRYDLNTKKLQYKTGTGNWENMDLESTGTINTSELTAENIKQGITVTITRGTQELKKVVGTYTGDATATAQDIISGKVAYSKGNKITGTYTPSTLANMTNDATATASDLIQGKTAYARGSKITGNISSYSGDRSISAPTLNGNNLYTPTITNGNYSNTRFYFSKGNLSPENIKKGVNIFGVTGSMDSGRVLGALWANFWNSGGGKDTVVWDSSYLTKKDNLTLRLTQSANIIFKKSIYSTENSQFSFNYNDGYFNSGQEFTMTINTISTGQINACIVITLA